MDGRALILAQTDTDCVYNFHGQSFAVKTG